MLYLEPQLSPKEEMFWFNQRPQVVWELPVGVRNGVTVGEGMSVLPGAGQVEGSAERVRTQGWTGLFTIH